MTPTTVPLLPEAVQRWWRTVPDGLSVSQAQSGVDKLAHRMDERRLPIRGVSTTVDELAKFEALLDIPVRPLPAELEVERTVNPQSLVQFDGTATPSRRACLASRSKYCTAWARTIYGLPPQAGQ
ncbi:hypothetical protein GCM10010260_59280 [Streptomyces filipinensis]|uniref:Uncharacterized protein n=1 Tax=Streptomyces filipinensis TaxID=66887 RepID=A0A918IGN0_9ACTN|nr:hypothetical protein GCM10010260_59280 [Streptomyces filipinensis]